MTEAIVPRWEWRMFAERFGAAERRLASLATAPAQVSDERYVLGLRTQVKHGRAVYDGDVVHGTVLDRAEIDRQIELYRTRDGDQRRGIVGLQANRAPVMLAGACIVRSILAKLGRESLTVGDRGQRHGLLVERLPHPT